MPHPYSPLSTYMRYMVGTLFNRATACKPTPGHAVAFATSPHFTFLEVPRTGPISAAAVFESGHSKGQALLLGLAFSQPLAWGVRYHGAARQSQILPIPTRFDCFYRIWSIRLIGSGKSAGFCYSFPLTRRQYKNPETNSEGEAGLMRMARNNVLRTDVDN